MVAHYKKVYSAKAAIDTSVPKSLISSVKYNDQLKQEQLRKGARPQSAHSLSQRSRVSCSPAQYNESHSSRSSVLSSPRFSTSFPPKNIVYPSFKVDFHRPASESKYFIPEASFRKQSAISLGATGHQSFYRTFQDPVQKTYSGDVLQKHSQRFTDDKPFTPKTLKSDKSSYLSKYRYYRAPQKKSAQDGKSLHHQETLHKRESTQEIDQRSQGFSTDHDLSEDDSYVLASRQHNLTHRREHELSHSVSKFASEGRKSPFMKSVNAEEEELKYLEVITAVTDDILSRGYISDRVVDRVINRHIDMNRHHLHEGKMRHLLEILRKDLEEPRSAPISCLKLERTENEILDTLLPQVKGSEQTKEDHDQFRYVSLLQNYDSTDYTHPILTSTLMSEPEKTSTSEFKEEEGTVLPFINKHNGLSEENVHENQSETEDKVDPNQSEENDRDRLLKQLDDVRTVLESLNVSDDTHCDNLETTNEEQASAALSDDDF